MLSGFLELIKLSLNPESVLRVRIASFWETVHCAATVHFSSPVSLAAASQCVNFRWSTGLILLN